MTMLNQMSSHALIARLDELVALERRTIVDELLCLAEIERRRIHVEMGCSSLFVFCTRRMKLPKGSAWSLATLVLLNDVMEEDPGGILDRAAGKMEDEVRDLVAALRPREAMPDLFTRIAASAGPSTQEPSREASKVPAGTSGVITGGHPQTAQMAQMEPDRDGSRRAAECGGDGAVREAEIAAAATRLRTATIEPISGELRRMHVTVSREFVED